MSAADDTSIVASRVATGPGTLLRLAREAREMTKEELARVTRLEPKIIEALEAEAWDKLAGPAFIKGYMRGIARELGIDPAPAIADYNAQFNTAEPALSQFESRAPLELTTANRWIKAMSFAVFGAITVGVAVWWQANYVQPTPPTGPGEMPVEDTGPKPEPATPLPYSWTVVEHAGLPLDSPQSWRRQTDGSAPPPLPNPEEAASAGATDAALTSPLTPATMPAAIAKAETAAKPEPKPEVRPELKAEAKAETKTEPKPAPIEGAPPAQAPRGALVLSASESSWVRVTDASGKAIWQGMLQAGQKIGLDGKAPLDLLIGNARVVTVSYEGQSQLIQNPSTNGVGRLTVGEHTQGR
jgi:cytoskeleton protein RodZ